MNNILLYCFTLYINFYHTYFFFIEVSSIAKRCMFTCVTYFHILKFLEFILDIFIINIPFLYIYVCIGMLIVFYVFCYQSQAFFSDDASTHVKSPSGQYREETVVIIFFTLKKSYYII